jgi:adenine phosphoribosyltransferase
VLEVRRQLLERFRWVDGHADVWRLFDDARLFARLIAALADPYRNDRVTKVAGIEARGFILGSGVALELHAGFVAVRKPGSLFPGDKVSRTTPMDYRGVRTELRLQRDAIGSGDRVLLVDDWFETGSQAGTAIELIESAGGRVVGASVIVDQLSVTTGLSARVGRYRALIPYADLPTSGTTSSD